jgi:hypothetical protein
VAKGQQIQLDTSIDGARQFLRAIDRHSNVRWDGATWVDCAGQPAANSLVCSALRDAENRPLALPPGDAAA